ncbi:MmgE/PrpD family protein [Hydrogenophaga sp. BPS33]|uniref:MmgE/PrpD family protein n=1 Tax=Hydrogenophaga sp. BPS33 TaxID=2651974 RepID=UPI00131F99A0|nr:MmgE/PrpD family protein [Hydrogenophaga sp. BPS33]QHE83687.1 MmgE/PrpD family protein [Hydrogenophaga sp. BPS33]
MTSPIWKVHALSSNTTAALAAFVANLRHEDVPQDQYGYARKSVLDWLGCCVAGTREAEVRALGDVMADMGSAPHATLIARGAMASVLDAALLNGAAGNLLDLDDVHPQLIGHPSSVVVPTALAVAEWKGLSGRDVLTAYVAGYEAMVRMGLAMEPELYDRGWHATGALGVFGACAAAGHLLRLDAAQMVAAFGIAAAQAAGLRELFGTSSKCIHHGKAAMAGILACLWAQRGTQSAADVIGGRFGMRTLSEPVRTERVLDGLGTRFHLAQTCYKRHAACGSVHAAIDAALALRERPGFSVDDIERIDVRTHTLSVSLTAHNEQARTGYEAKYSMHYALALAFIEGSAELAVFSDVHVADPRVRALAARIHMSADPDMQYVEAMPSELTMTLRDGSRTVLRVDTPKGRPSNPMDWSDMAAKFRQLAAPTLEPSAIEQVIEDVARLEDVDVRALMQRLSTAEDAAAQAVAA